MPPEAQTVLHTWCRQTDWNAPTIVGGAGARLLTADGRSILDTSSLVSTRAAWPNAAISVTSTQGLSPP